MGRRPFLARFAISVKARQQFGGASWFSRLERKAYRGETRLKIIVHTISCTLLVWPQRADPDERVDSENRGQVDHRTTRYCVHRRLPWFDVPRGGTMPLLLGFVSPYLPTKAPQPPTGEAWLHEIDGFRVNSKAKMLDCWMAFGDDYLIITDANGLSKTIDP
jgi:hypothetical protein